MAQVPEQVLAWLYKVLHEYQDAQRTYSDSARTLSAYPALSPRTEVYTYDGGASALLLTLSGTLPVSFRGTTYRFPVKLWIPKSYPQESPMVYVTPGKEMVIRPGQHVGVDGRVYHPYLRDWSRMWDRASIAEFLEFLQQVFAKEPPVISRAQQQQYQRPIGRSPSSQQQFGASEGPPQLPPKQRMGEPEIANASNTSGPPPRPPKPGDDQQWPQRSSSRDITRDGPPLPPLPHEIQAQQGPRQYSAETYGQDPGPSQPIQSYGNGRPTGPPLPPIPDQSRPQQLSTQPYRATFNRSPVSPVSPINGYAGLPESKYSQPPPFRQSLPMQQTAFAQPQQQPTQAPYQPRTAHQQPPQQAPPQAQYRPGPTYSQPPPNQQLPLQKQRPLDLLTDPFDVAIGPPSTGPAFSAPPIPPNPEKEHLLHALSNTLVQQAQQKVHQNLSATTSLQAQQQALRAAHQRLESEIRQLDQLDKTLASNEAILHRSIQDCDRTISDAKSKPPPPIDEVLIGPTMVANQLWTLCAEEAACREAMYVLQRAVDRGRVSGNDFVKQMRNLGRECFLKMILAKKCASGLGLDRV